MSREHPILFNGPMVRAILEGRKTQTRRIVKLNASGRAQRGKKNWHCDDPEALQACPYQPGDRLWVKETWCDTRKGGFDKRVHYKLDIRDPSEANDIRLAHGLPWIPSIHMPRWASRITLEVGAVRLERLQGITEEDVKVEGLTKVTKDGQLYKWGIPDRDGLPGGCDEGWPWTKWDADPREGAFRALWDGIYDEGKSWESNPWVWVIDFHRIKP